MDGPPERGTVPAGFIGITRRPTRREWRRALILFAAGMVGLTLMLLFIHPQPSLLPVGTAAPPISLTSSDGAVVDLPGAAAGRPFVIEFFEAGCAHCQEVAGRLCHESAPVFAVDAARDSAATLSAFRRQYAPGCTYPMLVDPELRAAGAYAVSAVPTVYVVKGGRITFSGAGLDGIDALDSAIATALHG